MDVLAYEAQKYLSKALAPTTSSLYRTAFKKFASFCQWDRRSVLPLQEQALIRFVTQQAHRLRYQSIRTYLSGIQFYSLARGYPHLIAHMHKLFLVLRGIRRAQAESYTSSQKRPMTLWHILMLFDFVEARYSPVDAAMLRTAFSFAFYAMLRVSEYTARSSSAFDADSTLSTQ